MLVYPQPAYTSYLGAAGPLLGAWLSGELTWAPAMTGKNSDAGAMASASLNEFCKIVRNNFFFNV
jgi:hypothetical protein